MKPTTTVRPLRQWQAEALLQWQRSGNHGVVQAVRGAGKTEVGATAVGAAQDRGQPALVVVRDAKAANAWMQLLAERMPASTIEVLKAQADMRADVIVAQAGSLRELRRGRLRSDGLLVVDDVHLLSASDLSELSVSRFQDRLGLADYTSGWLPSSLAREFGAVIVGCDFGRARRDGHLASLHVVMVGVPFKADEMKRYSKLDDAVKRTRAELVRRYRCRANSEDNFEMDVRRLADGPSSDSGTQAARRYQASVAERRDSVDGCTGKTFALRELSPEMKRGGQTLVFTETKELASRAAEAMLEEGILAAPFSAGLDAGDRRELESTFENGVMSVLTVPSELDAMTSIPDAATAVISSSSRSRHSVLLRMGRVAGASDMVQPATIVVLYMQGTFEDPKFSTRDTFLDALTSAASEVTTTDVDGAIRIMASGTSPLRQTATPNDLFRRDDRALEELAFRIVDDESAAPIDDEPRIREMLRRTTASPTMDEVDRVLRSLSILDEREVSIVIARYGLDGDDPRTYPQIAAHVGVSAGRVSQIEKDALHKLVESRGENHGEI